MSRLQAAVAGRLGRRVHNFRVVVRDNGLVLQGQAPSYYAKQLAQHVVMETTHLPILINEIKVSRGRPPKAPEG
jgi:hypothetical protein